VSSAPIGQRGQTPAPSQSDGKLVGRSGGAGPAPGGEPPVSGQPPRGGWAVTAARYAPALVAGVTMAVLGLWGLARHSAMGNDEVVSRYAALLSLRNLAHLLRHVDAVHGLYYLLLHGWMVLGTSPAVMRIPSVLAMIAGVVLTVIIARRLTGSGWAGAFAGLIMALTPTISYYAQTARSYALVFAFVLGATLALLHAVAAEAAGQRATRRWVAYGALVTVAGYLNELALVVLVAHAVTVLLARYGRRAVAHWAAASAVAVVLVAPLAVLSTSQDGAVSWIPRPGLWSLRILFHDYFGATTAVALLVLGCAVVAALPARGWWQRQRAGAVPPGASAAVPPGASAAESGAAWWAAGGISLPSLAVPLLVLPGAILIIESLIARPLYVDRYVLYGEAGAALLAGAGIYRIGRWLAGPSGEARPSKPAGEARPRKPAGQRSLVWAPGAVVCICALVLQIGPQQRVREPQSRLYDFGGPSRYLAARAHTGDGVLFFSSFFRKARLGYPGQFRKTTDFAMAVSPTQAGNFLGQDKPTPVVESLMLGRQRIWVVGKNPNANLHAPQFRAEAALLRNHFTMIAGHHFKQVWVTLWLRH
jgi:mannosyltransferase